MTSEPDEYPMKRPDLPGVDPNRRQHPVPTWAIHATITGQSIGLVSAVVTGQVLAALLWLVALSTAFSWLIERKWGSNGTS